MSDTVSFTNSYNISISSGYSSSKCVMVIGKIGTYDPNDRSTLGRHGPKPACRMNSPDEENICPYDANSGLPAGSSDHIGGAHGGRGGLSVINQAGIIGIIFLQSQYGGVLDGLLFFELTVRRDK